MAVLQWKSLIAVNYAAKERGVKRQMTANEALALCTDIKLIHVSTMEEKNGKEIQIDSSAVKATRGAENKWRV